jgi:hypothetical protein
MGCRQIFERPISVSARGWRRLADVSLLIGNRLLPADNSKQQRAVNRTSMKG